LLRAGLYQSGAQHPDMRQHLLARQATAHTLALRLDQSIFN
jgi:hypothetical protein